MSRQVLRLCKIRLRRKARGYSRHFVEKIGQVQGNLKQEDSIEAQRRVLKDGKNMVLDARTRRLVATEEDQEHLNFLKIERVRGNSSLQETQKPKVKTKFGHRISKNLFTACHAEEVQDDLDKPRITAYKNKLESPRKYRFFQRRSNAITLFNNLPAICIEKMVYMKTGEEFFCNVFQSPRLPRDVLTPNLHHGR